LIRGFAAAVVFVIAAQGVQAGNIVAAAYDDPTRRYDHGILGDAIEHGTLVLKTRGGPDIRIVLPETRVFEDTAPRLADVDRDGDNEVIVVETMISKGARLAIYDDGGLVAATPWIGHTHRWLAPIGAADLDGDGFIEIAYIDRPHLARLLKIWRFRDGALTLVGTQGGMTNHRIGDRKISGGLRDCGAGPQMITTTPDWSKIVASVFENGEIRSAVIGPNKGQNSFRMALDCRM
jgi:hypothetical protein